ncbi:MAG: sugar acetyltransferase [Proteobacteria bacterium ST_bin11]|jgi:UDP-perosamine 4-acetyltransferase|nr:MAG: sugar acetyltransferase [Proteobacteria bacterium ST_bin11]
MSKPVILLGSGGHAKVLLNILRRCDFEIIGVTDPARTNGEHWLGCKILGDDLAVHAFSYKEVLLVNGLGSLPRDGGLRRKVFDRFTALGYQFLTVMDPSALVADQAGLAPGVQVMAGALIQLGAIIAENCIINSGAIVEHDCRIGRHVHIAPGAIMSGGVELGDDVHIGTGAILIQGIRIGNGSVIGAGSVVTQDVGEKKIVYPPRPQIQDL